MEVSSSLFLLCRYILNKSLDNLNRNWCVLETYRTLKLEILDFVIAFECEITGYHLHFAKCTPVKVLSEAELKEI